MSRRLRQVLLLLGWCVPYGFLGMYGDITFHAVLFYGMAALVPALLCTRAARLDSRWLPVTGTLLSHAVSALLLHGRTEQWSWYFKPFTPSGMLRLLSAALLLVQLAVWTRVRKGYGSRRP